MATERTVLRGARTGDIAFTDGVITDVGTIAPRPTDTVITVDGDIVTAGFVNTHHHLYQWMTRGQATGCNLFEWLTTLYPVWGRMDVEEALAVDGSHNLETETLDVLDEAVQHARLIAIGIRVHHACQVGS